MERTGTAFISNALELEQTQRPSPKLCAILVPFPASEFQILKTSKMKTSHYWLQGYLLP